MGKDFMEVLKKWQRVWWNGRIISVEDLHKLASDKRVSKICMRSSVSGDMPGAGRKQQKQKEFSHWELQYIAGVILNVYV